MNKRAKVLIGLAATLVVVVIAAIVGVRLYADYTNAQADDVPSLNTTTPAPSTDEGSTNIEAAPANDLTGTWTIGTGSFAGYRLDEVLSGQNITVTGRTEGVTGSVTIDGDQLTAGTVEVDLTTVATDDSSRDDYFRTEAIDTTQFPTATFELSEPAAVTADGSELTLVGTATINGVTAPVTVTAQVGQTATGLQVVGTAPITFADFGVQAPSLGFVTVEETGFLEFSLELTAA